MARKRRTKITPAELRERRFAGHTPGEAVTKEHHDAVVEAKGRPFTQDPIGTHPRSVPNNKDTQ